MADFYIRVDAEGNAVGHPDSKANLKYVYPDHDFDAGSPEGWAEFTVVEPPDLGVYQKFDSDITEGGQDGLQYTAIDGGFKHVWAVLDLTDAEKLEKQNQKKAEWAEVGHASWVFNEETCDFDAPVAHPSDGKTYEWSEDTTSWVEVTDA